jgi:hypothetical protein
LVLVLVLVLEGLVLVLVLEKVRTCPALEQTGFFKTCIIPFRKVSKIVRIDDFVEQTLLHKMWYVLSYSLKL